MEKLYEQCIENTSKQTEVPKEKAQLSWDDRRKLAYEAAYNEIIIGAEDKIKISMDRGFKRSEI